MNATALILPIIPESSKIVNQLLNNSPCLHSWSASHQSQDIKCLEPSPVLLMLRLKFSKVLESCFKVAFDNSTMQSPLPSFHLFPSETLFSQSTILPLVTKRPVLSAPGKACSALVSLQVGRV